MKNPQKGNFLCFDVEPDSKLIKTFTKWDWILIFLLITLDLIKKMTQLSYSKIKNTLSVELSH